MTIRQRPCTEHHFATHDGEQLFYRHWPAAGTRRGAIMLLHRGHEHSARVAHIVDELELPDFDFFAWDARGHGKSPGARGHSPSFGTSVRDVQTFADHIRDQHGVATHELVALGQSVGAVLAAAWVHDYAPPVRAMVLASPAFSIKLYVPFARPGLALMQKLRGNFFVNSYVKSKLLTHDRARQASYDSDPLIARAISVNMLLGLHDTARRIVDDAQAITAPTQLLISGADWVVHHGPQHRFFANLGAPIKEKHVLEGFFHDTLGERDRAQAMTHIRRFVLERFAQSAAAIDLRASDQRGHSFDEARALAQPLPALSPRGLFWRGYRAGLKLASRVSDGIRLGFETGFDSGSTLDYVYRDRPAGRGPLGRMIDRHYLDAIGWRGIRQRKRHLQELIHRTLDRLHADGQPLQIVDIAAGHGRYVIDALESSTHEAVSARLRDYSALNVREGQGLIAAKGLQARVGFEQGDAFDADSVAAVAPRPSLGIVSGLYELFPDNGMLERSLAGLAKAVLPGGYLIYTGQPWHPQLEMIARALTSHRGGQAWVMRRRSQQELDQLVAAAGFEKLEQRIDEWGIFTVSVARRLPA
jgi:alpha-beta hydrolase superfamily lysophospholipase